MNGFTLKPGRSALFPRQAYQPKNPEGFIQFLRRNQDDSDINRDEAGQSRELNQQVLKGMIGNLPVVTAGRMCVCIGPPDSIEMGSTTVLLSNKPAARMGDSTAHGGKIILGCPTVLVGG